MTDRDENQSADAQGDDITSRRELLSATAKFSALLGALGLTGVGLASTSAEAKTGDVTLKRGVIRSRMLPAVQKREMKLLIQDAMRTGNSRAAMQRHPNLKLSPRQQQILIGLKPQDWATLRRYEAKLKGIASGDDTGIIIY